MQTETSNTFKGPAPNSTPEATALTRMGEALRFEKFMDFHSTGREVLANYQCTGCKPRCRRWRVDIVCAAG